VVSLSLKELRIDERCNHPKVIKDLPIFHVENFVLEQSRLEIESGCRSQCPKREKYPQ
jgi:hypothetical protein